MKSKHFIGVPFEYSLFFSTGSVESATNYRRKWQITDSVFTVISPELQFNPDGIYNQVELYKSYKHFSSKCEKSDRLRLTDLVSL